MNWSIARKLPLFVTALLLAVAIAQLSIGYFSVRKASRGLAGGDVNLLLGNATGDPWLVGQSLAHHPVEGRDLRGRGDCRRCSGPDRARAA